MKLDKKWKELLILCVIYIGMWMLYYFSEIIMGRIKGLNAIVMNLIPVLFFLLAAACFWALHQRNMRGLRTGSIAFTIIILVIVDNIIKYIMRKNFNTGDMVGIIPGWAYLTPVLNTKGSWAASRYGLELGIGFYLLLNIMVIPLIIQSYRFFNYKGRKSFWVDVFFILFLSGSVCSLLDKGLFGGSLDFLSIGDLFVADTKDFYLTIGIGCMLAELFINQDAKTLLNSSNEDDVKLFKEFLQFSFKSRKKAQDRDNI